MDTLHPWENNVSIYTFIREKFRTLNFPPDSTDLNKMLTTTEQQGQLRVMLMKWITHLQKYPCTLFNAPLGDLIRVISTLENERMNVQREQLGDDDVGDQEEDDELEVENVGNDW